MPASLLMAFFVWTPSALLLSTLKHSHDCLNEYTVTAMETFIKQQECLFLAVDVANIKITQANTHAL